MLLTFPDRLRIPWIGGAKQISLDDFAPAVIVPFVIFTASINFYTAIILGLATPAFLGYTYYLLKRLKPKSKFFYMWTFWSATYMIVIFEYSVPMFELLPEEKYILVFNVILAIVFIVRTKQKASMNYVVQGLSSEDDLPDIAEAEEHTTLLLEDDNNPKTGCNEDDTNMCRVCRKYVQPRTYHCSVCQACIMKRSHHSMWLDCCIGHHNDRSYYLSLSFSFISLCLGSNLALTSVCHPVLMFHVYDIPILLPDDCSYVFEQYDLGLAFIISIYAFFVMIFVLVALVRQMYLISRGITFTEWRHGQSGNNRTIFHNWKVFVTRHV
ncbi:ZDHHC23 family protein [Megaselia abdita]